MSVLAVLGSSTRTEEHSQALSVEDQSEMVAFFAVLVLSSVSVCGKVCHRLLHTNRIQEYIEDVSILTT